MRLPFLRALAALMLVAPSARALEPRHAIEPGAPVLAAAVDHPGYGSLWTLASTRHPTLRHRLEADSDTAPASRKRGKAGRTAKTATDDETPATGATVTVQAGDTLYSLAGRNHATVEAVARLNGLKPPYALTPGRTLKLPAPKTYVARKGDTVGTVADRYGVKESLLRKANPDLAGDALRRGTKLVLPAAAKDAGADDHAQGSTPAASASAAPEADAKACPRGRGRRSCLAAVKAAKASAPEATAPDETAAFDLKACRRHASRRACAAQAKAAQTAAAKPKVAAVPLAEAAFDLKACRRHNSRRTCAAREQTAQAAAVETAAVSARKAGADVASAEQALRTCRRHHRARACTTEAKALTEAKASTSASAPNRRDAAAAATAALNLKSCRRRHSRRDCAAQASEATTAAASAPARETRPTATPEPDSGASAESMVASLPPAPPTSAGRTPTRQSGDAEGPSAAVATAPPSAPARATAPAVAEVSPGPRPYASVFGGASAPSRASGRPARDRSGRTSQDAQAAAAAAARRDYARASLPAAPSFGGGDAASGRPRFAWPVSGEVLSGFGSKGSGLRNDGVDLAASLGDPVRASAAGEVVYAGGAIPGFGNLVLVKHSGGWVTAYGHLSKISVAMRQTVRQGDVVGEAGQSGNVLRPELHFEIRYAATPEENAKPVDPAPLLPRRG